MILSISDLWRFLTCRLASLFLIIGLFSSILGCGGGTHGTNTNTSLSGRVIAITGENIQGVVVTNEEGNSSTTDEDGIFLLSINQDFLSDGETTLFISADFESQVVIQNIPSDTLEIIVLVSVDSQQKETQLEMVDFKKKENSDMPIKNDDSESNASNQVPSNIENNHENNNNHINNQNTNNSNNPSSNNPISSPDPTETPTPIPTTEGNPFSSNNDNPEEPNNTNNTQEVPEEEAPINDIPYSTPTPDPTSTPTPPQQESPYSDANGNSSNNGRPSGGGN